MLNIRSIKSTPEREEWTTHPFTQYVQRQMDGIRKRALANLLGACSVSDDENVRMYHAELMAVEDMLDFLKDSKGDKE